MPFINLTYIQSVAMIFFKENHLVSSGIWSNLGQFPNPNVKLKNYF